MTPAGERSRRGRRVHPAARLLVGVCLPVLLLQPGPAAAFEIFGFRFFEPAGDDEPVSPDAQPYTIEVDVVGADDDLSARIRSSSLLYTEREGRPPPSTAAFLSRVGAEYGRIVAGLYTEGHYGGVVTITVDGRDPESLSPDEPLPDPVAVKIDVDPGPRFAFGRLDVAGRAPQPLPEGDRLDDTPESVGFVPGGVARSAVVLRAEQILVDEWRQLGHPKAEIALRDAVADHPDRQLDVSVAVEAGPAAVYGPVTVTGTDRMKPDFVVRQSGLRPGEPYDPDDLAQAAKQLRRLQVFNAVRVVEGETVGPDGSLPMTLNVVERKRRLIGGGVSYSTTDGAGVDGYWEHRNLFGEAERLRLEGRVGGIDSVDPEDFTYFVGATFTKPGVITPLTDLVASITGQREVLDAYTENTAGARIGLTHEFSDQLKGAVAGSVQFSSSEDALGKRDLLMIALPASLTYDGSDDENNPTTGYRAKASLTPFYEVNFANVGTIAELGTSAYVPLGERVVLAGRLGTGSIVGAPRDELPASALFLRGGGSSIRGYAYRNVGPRQANGDVVGGRSYVEGSLEVRVKATETIGVVPFIDGGNAFKSSLPDFSEDLKFGAGIGVRYDTGLGPIRVDAAVPINPDKGDPSFAIYIGLGQAF